MDWREQIQSDPAVLRGKPCVKGTRIPAGVVLGYLAAGKSSDQIREEFPELSEEAIRACLQYACDLADFEVAV